MSQQVLPFYLVCDESASMAGEPVAAVNQSLPDIHYAITSQPAIADKTRFGLIGFAESAHVLLELTQLNKITDMPGLTAGGKTNYGSAFSRVRSTIRKDVKRLKDEGARVFRPTVFFLSDGMPTDTGWEAEHGALTDPGWDARPNILAFGFGLAELAVMRKVATVRAFMANGEISPADALAEFARTLIRSMIMTSRQPVRLGEQPDLVPPDQVRGFTAYRPEEI